MTRLQTYRGCRLQQQQQQQQQKPITLDKPSVCVSQPSFIIIFTQAHLALAGRQTPKGSTLNRALLRRHSSSSFTFSEAPWSSVHFLTTPASCRCHSHYINSCFDDPRRVITVKASCFHNAGNYSQTHDEAVNNCLQSICSQEGWRTVPRSTNRVWNRTCFLILFSETTKRLIPRRGVLCRRVLKPIVLLGLAC